MHVLADVRYALRSRARAPGFTVVAVLTLALGVGANTAIFSVVEAVLLRPLPFPNPERLTLIWGANSRTGRSEVPFSQPDFEDLRAGVRTFDSLGAMVLGRFTLAGKPEPELVQGAYATAGFFSTLGLSPASGQLFSPRDDERGGPAVALLSHSLWARRFAADPAVVGRTIVIDSRPFTIAGVLPSSFRLASFARDTEIWLPFSQDPFVDRRYARAVHSMAVIGRLRADATVARAQADLDLVAAHLRQAHPDDDANLEMRVVGLHDHAVKNLRSAVLVLYGAVAFVLLIACANVANLLAARSTGRQREIAVRSALGASPRRLIEQWLTESVVLGLLGGLTGLLFALWGIDLLSRAPLQGEGAPGQVGIAVGGIALNGTVFAFTLGLSVLAGLAVGLVPAWQSLRDSTGARLKDASLASTAGPRRQRVLGTLVSAQVALSVTLLAGALLTATSLFRLLRVDPGFTATSVLTFDLNLAESRYGDPHRTAAFYDALLTRVRQLPGASAAGAVEYMPLTGTEATTVAFAADRPLPARGQEQRVDYASATPGYFPAMGVPVRGGRTFTDADRADAPRVAVINETLAPRLWPGESPIGKRLSMMLESLRYFRDRAPEFDPALGMREVVGVVADARRNGFSDAAPAEIYVPFAQRPVRDLTVVVGVEGDPAALTSAVRQAVAALDPEQPLGSVRTLEQIVDASVAQPRFNSVLVSSFALLALVLSAVGIYGVLSYVVTERTRETGVRLALGAERSDIVRLMMGRGLRFTATGVAVGLAGAAGVSVLLTRLLFGISAAEPLVYAGSAATVMLAAFAACYLPARRAARLDAVAALRHE